jgi:hypothetical protein
MGVHPGISLLEQGYFLNQIKILLARESDQEPSIEAAKA